MSRQHHYLKILPEYFRAITNEDKTFEVRCNDQDYKKGDILHLEECVDNTYTGRVITAEVTYLLDNSDFCKEGFVIMSIKIMDIIL